MAKQEIKKNPTSDETIHPGQLTIFDEISQIAKSNKLVDRVETKTLYIKRLISDIFTNYLDIGYNLNEIQKTKLYEVLDYEHVYDYAQNEFDMSITTIKNCMAISKRFCNAIGDLKEEFKDYNYSQLVELISVKDEDLGKFDPSISVKNTRLKKKILKLEEELNIDINDTLNDYVQYIMEYDYNHLLKDVYDYDFIVKNKSNDYSEILTFRRKSPYVLFHLFDHKTEEEITSFFLHLYAEETAYIELRYNNLRYGFLEYTSNRIYDFEAFKHEFEIMLIKIYHDKYKLDQQLHEIETNVKKTIESSSNDEQSIQKNEETKQLQPGENGYYYPNEYSDQDVCLHRLNKDHLDEFMSFVMINKRYPLIKDEIIDLVHKSMPVKSDYGKPIDQDDTLFLNRVCPVCHNIILMEYPFDYCPFCGQRLEGEEYDE